MDTLILAERIDALRRCLKRVEAKRTESPDALQADPDRQDIISLNLTRAVQLCVDMATHVLADTEQPLPQTMADAFDRLAAEGIIPAETATRMRRAVGFRNVAVHSYQAIDWHIVHTISHQGLEDFRDFARHLSRLIEG
jgi:uncharacterized protein YutE (UPF0331/DUF86 family)